MADEQAECFSTHLIEGDGTFNEVGLDNFIKEVKMGGLELAYAVVSIMGPQSSGKSTLLNHLFNTNFKEMNAYKGKSQTTKGIWIARCPGIEPCTIVMDLEGCNGREQGQDNTAFERQIALLALAVSDVVLINISYNEIGREHAANALLKIVFEVMLRLFSPRKTTLMFVIRDKSFKTPLGLLERTMKEDIQKIWDSIPKPEAHKQTPFSDFFNVQYIGLSNYEEKEDKFKEEVAILKERFSKSIEAGGLAGDRQGVIPASGFSLSAQRIWKVIKENKDLDFPSHKVMVANIRCEEIANEEYSSFTANEEWLKIKELVKSNLVPGFGSKVSLLLGNSLSCYDKKATYYEESVKNAKRKLLEEKLIQLVQPTYQEMLKHMISETSKNFENAFTDALNEKIGFALAARDCSKKFMTLFDEKYQDAFIEQGNWDSSKERDKFSSDLESHITEVRNTKLSELTALNKSKLEKALYGPVGVLLKTGTDDTWSIIRTRLHSETEAVVSDFSSALSGFEIGEQAEEIMISDLKDHAIGIIERKAREEAAKVLTYVKDRFIKTFNYDDLMTTRLWTNGEDIPAIKKNAHSSVPATKILITPDECISVWNQLLSDTEYTITQAIASQEQYNRNLEERKEREQKELERIKREENERNERELRDQERNEREERERNERELRERERNEREERERNERNERERIERERNEQLLKELNERNRPRPPADILGVIEAVVPFVALLTGRRPA